MLKGNNMWRKDLSMAPKTKGLTLVKTNGKKIF